MQRIILDMSPSLDGYIAGTGVTIDQPFGDAGHRLDRWLGFEGQTPDAADDEAAARMLSSAGAVVIGRRMFDVGIAHWGDDGAFGRPCFVVTHRPRADVVKGPTTFKFVTQGTRHAMALASEAAGDLDVVVAGGAGIAQQCLAAGLVDELRLHIVPVLLGRGTPLFEPGYPMRELRPTKVLATSNAVHLTLEVLRPT